MDILHDVLGFAAKGFVVFATVAATVLFCLSVARRKRPAGSRLRVEQLNRRIEALGDALRGKLLGKKDLRKLYTSRKKALAERDGARPNVFVLEFEGDLFARAVGNLRVEVTEFTAASGQGHDVVHRHGSQRAPGPMWRL